MTSAVNLNVRAFFETLRSVNSNTFDGDLNPMGGPLLHPACVIKFINASDEDAFFSFDGMNIHDVCPAGAFALYDFTSDRATSQGLYLAQGTQVYILGASPGTGLVYMTVMYPGP